MTDSPFDQLAGRDSAIWHPSTPTPHRGPRAVFTRAEGAYVYDESGNRYLDATSSWWCITHGHGHPRLVGALAKQAAVLDHVMLAPHAHPPALQLADKLVERLGSPFSKVFFSDDGSTAVEAAMKMALQYWRNVGEPRRRRFLSLELGYHGDTLGAVSVGGVSAFHDAFEGAAPLVPGRAQAPYCYRCPIGLSYPSCATACLDSARRVVAEHGNEIAALIVEPLVLGAAGMIVYPPSYLEGLVALCREKGILVIFDEVFTGFGRTGTFFALEQVKAEARPDFVCLSKGLTAGMLPLAATVARSGIFEAFAGGGARTFHHGHTFTGNPLGCAVALESLALFDEEHTLERIAKISALMASQSERFRALAHVGEVRHLGAIWAVELVRDKKSRAVFEPANGPGWRIASQLWRDGIWLRPLHNMLYVVPPYCVGESDLQRLFDVLYSELRLESHFEE